MEMVLTDQFLAIAIMAIQMKQVPLTLILITPGKQNDWHNEIKRWTTGFKVKILSFMTSDMNML